MAEKKKAATKPASKKTTKPVEAVAKPAKAVKADKVAKKRSIRAPKWLRLIGGYFKGAWVELRLVRWPNRKATWSLTMAVILFSVFFAALILGLDTLFRYLFKEILL